MAQKKQVKKGGMSAGKMAAIGAGVAAVGAGAYYLLGPNGKKNQKKAEAWVENMEKEIETKAKPTLAQARKVMDDTMNTMKRFTSKEKPVVKKMEKKAAKTVKKIEKTAKKDISKAKKILNK